MTSSTTLVGVSSVEHAKMRWCSDKEKPRVLTQADVVGEEVQELCALLLLISARRTGAPRGHAGRGVVHVVGSHWASCQSEVNEV